MHNKKNFLNFSKIHIMGILNITPDSFFDGGSYFNNLNKALRHANKMIKEGATIIDIGGESTRPGHKKISLDEELNRVIPVIEAISKRFEVFISVDTYKPEVMLQAADYGAHIINDVYSLSKKESLKAAVKTGLFVCLTHHKMNNKLKNCTKILDNINVFFKKTINKCIKKGIKKSNILIDPGFGFGKNIYQNYVILSNLNKFNYLNIPILIGISHKSMVRNLLKKNNKNNTLLGSLVCAVIAITQGVRILRVHNVKETLKAINNVYNNLKDL